MLKFFIYNIIEFIINIYISNKAMILAKYIYKYKCEWSYEDNEFVATCNKFKYLSSIDANREVALKTCKTMVEKLIKENFMACALTKVFKRIKIKFLMENKINTHEEYKKVSRFYTEYQSNQIQKNYGYINVYSCFENEVFLVYLNQQDICNIKNKKNDLNEWMNKGDVLIRSEYYNYNTGKWNSLTD